MMRKFLFCLLAFVFGFVVTNLFVSTCAQGEPAPLLHLDGPITDDSVAPIKTELIRRIVAKDKLPIDILIDSPGGVVTAGQDIINLIALAKANKQTVRCYAQSMVASMAFYIFTQCSQRFSLPGSYLLWHGSRVGTRGTFTEKTSRDLAESLGQLDRLFKFQLFGSLRMKADVIMDHFHKETLWSGIALSKEAARFMTIKDAYPDLVPRLPAAIRTVSQRSIFQLMDGKYTCIWKGFQAQ